MIKRARLHYLKPIWLIVVALGGMYTIVQFVYSGWQLMGPRLSYEVQSSYIPSIFPSEMVHVPVDFVVRNDGFWPSSEVQSFFNLTTGSLSDHYHFVLSTQLFSLSLPQETGTYDVYNSTGPLGSGFFEQWPHGFVVNIPSVPRLSEMRFSFTVTTSSSPLTVFMKIRANVTALSDDGIVESTRMYRVQSMAIQYQFVAYLVGSVVIVAAGILLRNEWDSSPKTVQRTHHRRVILSFVRDHLLSSFPYLVIGLAAAASLTWYLRTRAFSSFSLNAMAYQAQRPDLPIGFPFIHATIWSDQFCLGSLLNCWTEPPFDAVFAVLEILLISSMLFWIFSTRYYSSRIG